jgi:CelD/BcsL family acetyltransferase involved in cellulose biosynthesis
MNNNPITVAFLEEYDTATLERDWRALEQHAHSSVFQSWAWISCWLASLPPDVHPLLIRVSRGREIIALGMLCRAKVRAKFGMARALLLNETGAASLDCVTIEHNGLLCDPAMAGELVEQVALALQKRGDWDEWVLSGVDRSVAEAHYESLAARMGWMIHTFGESPCYFVELDKVRAGGPDHLDWLSVNTRYQVRRALKEYGMRGEVKIEVARSVEEALAFLERLKVFHQRYWEARGKPGAFGPQFFEIFHRRFIQQGWSTGAVQLSRVSAGEHEVGYLYNLVHAQTIYSYQSGFNYETDAKIKPGLVSHVLAIQTAMAGGFDCYDLLAGDGQYKRSLATHSETMRWIRLRRPRIAFRLEALARRVRDESRERLEALLNRAQLRGARHH